MSIEKKTIGQCRDGKMVSAYILKNGQGMAAEILTYGCRVARLYAPNKYGKSENVVLGHRTLGEYEKDGDVLGAVIGRYANRIAGAQVEVNGSIYHMYKNEGENSLHSSPGGYQNRNWKPVSENENGNSPSVTFYYFDKGESNLPGHVKVYVTYKLTADNELVIDYKAETDAETPFSPTNHTYFNITGDEGKSICPLEAKIYADYITEVKSDLIPTGKLLPAAGTPYGFKEYKAIGRDIGADDKMLKVCGGYDINYVINGNKGNINKAAEMFDKVSGRKLEVFTDMPGLQFYTANSFCKDALGTNGKEFKPHCAACFEAQFFPDSVHHTSFPYENLKPEKNFHSITIYKFSVA